MVAELVNPSCVQRPEESALVSGVPKLEVIPRTLQQEGTEPSLFLELFPITSCPHWWIFAPNAFVFLLFPFPFFSFLFLI